MNIKRHRFLPLSLVSFVFSSLAAAQISDKDIPKYKSLSIGTSSPAQPPQQSIKEEEEFDLITKEEVSDINSTNKTSLSSTNTAMTPWLLINNTITEEQLCKEEAKNETIQDEKNYDPQKALLQAIIEEDIDKLSSLLLKKKVDIYHRYGVYTILHIAAQQGKLKSVKWCITKANIKVDYLSSSTGLDSTPFMEAGKHLQLAVMQYLYKAKADILSRDKEGRNTLHWVCKNKSYNVGDSIEWLCKTNKKLLTMRVFKTNYTPTHYAVTFDNLLALEALQKVKADFSIITTEKRKESLLHLATRASIPIIIEFLVKKAHIPVDIENYKKQTSAFKAVARNDFPILKKLFDLGANLKKVDTNNKNLLDIFYDAKQSNSELENFLIQHIKDLKKKV